MSRTQPQCEACWIDEQGEFETHALGTRHLTRVRQPSRLVEPKIERCATCGRPTIFGLYVRKDPATVPFPSQDRDQS